MKALLFLTWVLIGVAGYYAYNFYQQDAVTVNQLQAANAQIASLQDQLASVKKQFEALRLSVSIKATAMGGSADNTKSQPVIPTTITTLTGKTYTGCVLSSVTPDGISFTHSLGVAKVLFTDLDASFGATFGYNPDAAEKYEQQQALAEANSDANRTAAEKSDAAEAIQHSVLPTEASAAKAAANGTPPGTSAAPR